MIEDILNEVRDRAFWFNEESEGYELYENDWDIFSDILEEVLEDKLFENVD